MQLREFVTDPNTVAAFGRTVRLTPEGLVGLDQTGAMLAEDGASLMCRAAVIADLGGLWGDGPLADLEFRERIVSYYGSHVVAPISAVLSLTPCRYWTGPAGPRETAEEERAEAAFSSAWLKRHLLAKGSREALYMPL
jgi:hypothetical protein